MEIFCHFTLKLDFSQKFIEILSMINLNQSSNKLFQSKCSTSSTPAHNEWRQDVKKAQAYYLFRIILKLVKLIQMLFSLNQFWRIVFLACLKLTLVPRFSLLICLKTSFLHFKLMFTQERFTSMSAKVLSMVVLCKEFVFRIEFVLLGDQSVCCLD